MRSSQFVIATSVIVALAAPTFAQDRSLPGSAKVTTDDSGNVTGVRIAGKSNLDRVVITTEAVETLGRFERLETLSLWGTTADDDDIKRLAGLRKLRVIDLTFTDVTGASLRTLSTLPELISVRLEGCNVTDKQLAPLADMPQLAMLYLGRTKVTDAGLKHLSKLKNLILLQLSDCRITDAGLASLGDLPRIQSLWLSKTIRFGDDDRSDLTDKSIEYLVSLKTLRDLRIADSQLTEAGIQKLRACLPKAKVSTERTGITYPKAKQK